MTAWIDAFGPTFALIALGYALRARFVTDDAVWSGLERLVFWLFLPALLASSIATIDLSRLPLGRLAVSILLPLLAGTASAIATARLLRRDHAAATSVLQGTIRFNNFVGFPVAGGLFGPEGIAFGAIASGLIVPFVQVILTIVFETGDRRTSPAALARRVALNPLILGCLLGFAFAVAGGLPPGLGPLGRSLGQAALAPGLLCVGAGLSLGALRTLPLLHALVGLQKLVLLPLMVLVLIRFLGLDGAVAAVAVLFMAMPTATTSYVMARAMGGDAPLMAAIITVQHLAAVLTLPAWALILAR